jgi:hypothetical protein
MKWPRSRHKRDADLDVEIQGHIAMAIAERVERGETPDDAERAVRREFGNVGVVKDVTRDMWGADWLRTEFKWAIRNVRARGMRGLLTVTLLGLVIGANVIIFSVADSLVLHRVTYRDPDQLFTIGPINPRTGKPAAGASMPVAEIEVWRRQTDLFLGIEGHLGKMGCRRDVRRLSVSIKCRRNLASTGRAWAAHARVWQEHLHGLPNQTRRATQ